MSVADWVEHQQGCIRSANSRSFDLECQLRNYSRSDQACRSNQEGIPIYAWSAVIIMNVQQLTSNQLEEVLVL